MSGMRKKPKLTITHTNGGTKEGNQSQKGISNWLDRFTPSGTAKLAVHPKKIEEVEFWLKNCGKLCRILLLTGPPGCGKTACLKAVAAEQNFEVVEWISPIDEEFSRDSQSQKEKFTEFLFKSSRYGSLFDVRPRILLVEDFPNAIIDEKQKFFDILAQYKVTGKSSLIFIATETTSKTLNIVFNLFPDTVQTEFGIYSIAFNPISNTNMKKALQQILTKIRNIQEFRVNFREPTPEILESVIVSSQGDIRNAILNLQFVSHKSLPKVEIESVLELSTKDLNRKRPKRVNDTNKLKALGRDENISLMHGIGRVFTPKFDESKKLTHCPELLTDTFSTMPSSFVSFIYSNYPARLSSIANCAEVSNLLSQSDVLLTDYRDSSLATLALTLTVRGTMLSNEKTVPGFVSVKGFKMDKSREIQTLDRYLKYVSDSTEPLVTKNTFVQDMQDALKLVGNLTLEDSAMNIESEDFVIEECEDEFE